jgi:hypothetical protein
MTRVEASVWLEAYEEKKEMLSQHSWFAEWAKYLKEKYCD